MNDQEDMERSPGRKKDGPNPIGRSFVVAVDRKTGATRFIQLSSEFDYKRQAILYLPKRMPDPRSPQFAAAGVVAGCRRRYMTVM